MIRYEIGDLVSVKKSEDGKLYIDRLAGRQADMLYTTDGRPIFYFHCISLLEPFQDIRQFQLIQEDYHHFTWVLNTDNHSYETEIEKFSRNLFGDDSEWKFEYVNEIPKLRSGKTKMTICKIDNN
jgi:phenylacetate-CoA ligase